MTAGRGIVHSEMPKVTEGNLWGFQLWINLPKKDKMVKPRSVYLLHHHCVQIVIINIITIVIVIFIIIIIITTVFQ